MPGLDHHREMSIVLANMQVITHGIEDAQAGNIREVRVNGMQAEGSILSPTGSLKKSSAAREEHFDFMFHKPSSQGLSPINSTAVSPASSFKHNQQKVAEQFSAMQASDQVDTDPEFAIERPTCPQNSADNSQSGSRLEGIPQQLHGFKPLQSVRQVSGFAVPPKPPSSREKVAASAEVDNCTASNSTRSPASGLVNQVTKKAASLFGSALDLVSLGSSSPNNASDSESSPSQSRKSSKCVTPSLSFPLF